MVDLLRRARQAGLAGATVYAAHEGYGESGRVHRVHLVLDDRPVAVVIVDQSEKVDAFLDEAADLLDDVVVVVDDIEIVET
jgi:PII-like signaling protein